MSGGTVNIARSIWSNPAFKRQPFTEREAFIYLVMEASWKARDKRVGDKIIPLQRGQLAVSIRFLADAWSWEKSTVDRFLKRLKKRDSIGTDSGTGVTVITICNYDIYQLGENKTGQAKSPRRDSRGTAAGQTIRPDERPDEKHNPQTPLEGGREGEAENDKESGLGQRGDTGPDTEPPAGPPCASGSTSEIRQAFDAWNATAAKAGLPQAKILSPSREQKLRLRIAEAGGIDAWLEAVESVASSRTLTGKTEIAFRADLDFVCNPAKFARLVEGFYHNGKAPTAKPKLTEAQLRERAERSARALAYD